MNIKDKEIYTINFLFKPQKYNQILKYNHILKYNTSNFLRSEHRNVMYAQIFMFHPAIYNTNVNRIDA